MSIVAAILTTKKAPMFVLTMPAMNGFNSAAPEYRTPITVVKQSMEPIKTIRIHGNVFVFSICAPSRFLFRFDYDFVRLYMSQLAVLDIFQIAKYAFFWDNHLPEFRFI
jgi:hypothetical protein